MEIPIYYLRISIQNKKMTPRFHISRQNSVYYAVNDRENKFGPERTSTNYELEMYLSEGAVSYLNGEKIEVRENLLLLARPGDVRRTFGNFSCINIHFSCSDPAFEEEYLHPETQYCMPIRLGDTDYTFRRLLELTNSEEYGKELRAESILLSLIADFRDSVHTQSLTRSRYGRYVEDVRRSCRYMEEHFAEPLTVGDLAAMIPVSSNFYQLIFRELIGKPPASYLRRIRLLKAEQFLTGTDMPLAEVAEKTGLKNGSYLTYVFKKERGITPSEYRRQQRNLL